MQIVVILSQPQRVKSFISSRTLLSRLFKPIAYTETTCDPDLSIGCLKSHFIVKIWFPTKWLQNVAIIYYDIV